MEWVETTAKTVEEAKDLALDKLGVDEAEAEFEILEEPRPGLFGRIRGEGRVRARIRPKAPRAKDESKRRRRSKKDDSAPPAANVESTPAVEDETPAPAAAPSSGRQTDDGAGRRAASGPERPSRNRSKPAAARQPHEEHSMEEVTATVESFLSGLTQAFGIDTTISTVEEDGQLMATIEGKHGLLLGPKAHTLDAIQELTRVTVQRSTPSSVRIKVDVGGYREARRAALVGFAQAAAARALDEGVEVVLEPMNAADRKTVHDAINEISGVVTRSAGTEPRRRVVVGPEAGARVTKDEEE
jgi:spoIIIJ-associated protein